MLRVVDFGKFARSRPCQLRKFLFVFSNFGIILAIANGDGVPKTGTIERDLITRWVCCSSCSSWLQASSER
jgi:hypothetical protein